MIKPKVNKTPVRAERSHGSTYLINVGLISIMFTIMELQPAMCPADLNQFILN